VDRSEYEDRLDSLRAELGAEQFATAWEEGRALSLEQAVEQALEG
jgi:hypothetical protein